MNEEDWGLIKMWFVWELLGLDVDWVKCCEGGIVIDEVFVEWGLSVGVERMVKERRRKKWTSWKKC